MNYRLKTYIQQVASEKVGRWRKFVSYKEAYGLSGDERLQHCLWWGEVLQGNCCSAAGELLAALGALSLKKIVCDAACRETAVLAAAV